MKRIVSLIFLLGFLLLVIQFSTNFFKNDHEFNYQVMSNNKE